MSEWRDIASAPLDGSSVLLCFEGGRVSVGYWDAYYAEGGRGFEGGVAWIEPISGERLDLNYDPPLAWMPLPDPPKEQGE